MLSEMLRLDPLTPLREAAEHILFRNRHPLNQNVLVPKLHLKDPFPFNRPHSGIKVTSTVTAKTVKPPPASPQDGTGQDMKAMMQDMIRSSLTEYGVIPKASPTQYQSQSIAVDTETPQVVELSEGELSDSEQEVLIQELLN